MPFAVHDLVKLFRNHGIHHSPPNKRGWVILTCPKCQGAERLGWSPNYQRFKCWLCGSLPFPQTLAGILSMPIPEAMRLLDKYPGIGIDVRPEVKQRGGAASLVYPQYVGPLETIHIEYLKKRGLDPERIMAEFGEIYGTPAHAPYLPFHIFFPLYKDGVAVSWQARNVRADCPPKKRYCTCAPDKEIIWHKELVYGMDAVPGDTCVVVEGVFDTIKLGPGSVHTFGTSFIPAQVKLLAERFRKIIVMFDSKGPQDPRGLAQRAGKQLAEALAGLGRETAVVDPEDSKDPGDWPVEKARLCMAQLLGI